ncbi:MAG: Sugar or nucleoside kinase, ribokinase family [Candidatus Fermentimicrarchaeum limneticum]|uniref:Sugar or nucleoside kinase, ribokinase family n=1 Tax=Fermentimicrarchaeum limneticum TaxID=2795018 RepID=A0A7D6BM86_FERL1|nr:MAG: Sugar or nucleoside kinase, ribokinase family [Candidatus Fermentimicrarchaeum limneticum]
MIYVVGQVVFDSISELKQFPKPNSTSYIKRYGKFFGGAAGNVAAACSKMGQKASLVSFVGEDFKGSAYEKYLKSNRIDMTHLKIVKGEKTPHAFMFNDSAGRQMSFFYWGSAEMFHTAPIPKLRFGRNDVVHLANGSPNFNMRFARKYPGVSFDPGYDIVAYKKEDIEGVLKNTRILSCNEFEMSRILKLLRLKRREELFAFPVECIVVTKGKRGSSVATRDESFEVPAIKAKLVDPTGAGDSFRAAFLSAFLRRESIETCAKIASSVASFVVEKYGAQTNIPTWKEAAERLRES